MILTKPLEKCLKREKEIFFSKAKKNCYDKREKNLNSTFLL